MSRWGPDVPLRDQFTAILVARYQAEAHPAAEAHMHIPLAPDEFKGSLNAAAACRALAMGIRAIPPDDV